ncbi:alpha-1,2-mannosyltransferase ktr1 [Coemansia sp. RSA 1933]|nr:alpha-1,2-mannosyltransferase ktr1 [Coemansia sp. RSA 1933]
MASSRLKRWLLLCIAVLGLVSVYTYIDYTRKVASEGGWGHDGGASQNGQSPYDFADATTNGTLGKGTVKAAMVALVRNSELDGMRSTIRQIEDRFNRRFEYPYIFLNDEDFTEKFKKGIRAMTKAQVYFGKLPADHWGLSKYVNEEAVQEALKRNKGRYLYGGSYSYRLMCRYQSGFIHKHPLLKDLEFYWRIEPGVSYFCDLPYDPFKYMKDNKLVYGFTITPMEIADTVETLWDTTRKWILENSHFLPQKSFIQWVVNDKSRYTMCHFWSNFEIVDLSFYRSEAYESFFQHLDRSGGFFYERWGDAPVHSIAAAMLLRKDQLHWFEDVGYHHPGYSHCPNKPEMQSKCVCSGSENYMYRSVCNRRFGNTDDVPKSRALELAALPDKK